MNKKQRLLKGVAKVPDLVAKSNERKSVTPSGFEKLPQLWRMSCRRAMAEAGGVAGRVEWNMGRERHIDDRKRTLLFMHGLESRI